MCSCGGNSIIDHINEVGGNQVKIRPTEHSSLGIRIILLKKQLSHEKSVCTLLKRHNHGDIVCMCVCVSFTPHSVDFLLGFPPAHVSACSGVIGSVCVGDGVWLVILARPKCCHVRGLTCRIF